MIEIAKGSQVKIGARFDAGVDSLDKKAITWHCDNNNVVGVSEIDPVTPDGDAQAVISGRAHGTCHIWAESGNMKSGRLVIHVPDKSTAPIELVILTG